MSKVKITNPAFQDMESQGVGFNLITNTTSLQAVFDFKPLDADEAREIERLLSDNATDVTTKEQLLNDTRSLKECSAEIKAIGKQGVVLTGERIHRAREILKPYRDGTFSKWLELTFGTRKTGYNMLSYYELFVSLPVGETQDQFRQIAQKPAYILASRKGPVETKIEVIKKARGMGSDELVTLIQERLPSAPEDNRTVKGNVNSKTIAHIRNALQKLQRNSATLTKGDMTELRQLRDLIDELIP